MIMVRIYYSIVFIFLLSSCKGIVPGEKEEIILTGAERTDLYLKLIQDKNVALVANQTSKVNNQHLVDTLSAIGIDILKVFAPEHGFRGERGAGIQIEDGRDPQTGIEVISLYGAKKKPSVEDLEGIDIVIFDIQDVGARFYTYISTLHYVMEACAENELDLIILDRPNPNGNYVDGPVLDTAFRSFVGMHEVPVIHGMTIAEYALMINGEKWLKDELLCNLHIVRCQNYNHSSSYVLPVSPSPNLNSQEAVILYPSLCFFEGTVVSAGRGTKFPFLIYGHPDLGYGDFYFTPVSIPGVAIHPKHENVQCRGEDLKDFLKDKDQMESLNLQWILKAYQDLAEENNFFTYYFNLLAGNDLLQAQIKNGLTEPEIRASWEEDLKKFLKIRKKYLLYPE